VLLWGSLIGCGSSQVVIPCAADLRFTFSPLDTTISIGQHFPAHVAISGCSGTDPLTDVITWRSDDSTVVSVDKTTGVASGVSVGQTNLWATGAKYGTVRGTLVHVK
jgi:hypothetical protein